MKATEKETKKDQKRFHDERAKIYDSTVTNLTFWRAFDAFTLHKWAEHIHKGMKVLDLGCGTGKCTLQVAQKGATVTGVDLSRGMIDIIVDKCKSQVFKDSIQLVIGDVENLPFKGESFDIAVSFGTLHHIPNPDRAVNEASKVLKPGGLFFATEPNKNQLQPPLLTLFKLIKKGRREKERNSQKHFHAKLDPTKMKMWLNNAKIDASIRTSAYRFIPYIRLYPKNVNLAKAILRITDLICECVPRLKGRGSILVIEGKK